MSNLEPQSNRYSEKINSISQQFFSVLEDFKKYYVFFNKNPEVNEYQQFYLNSKTQLQNLNRDIFNTTNDIEKDIENLNRVMSGLNIKLSNEKELSGELTKLMNNLNNTGNGAYTMLEDTSEIYKKQYYKNIELVMGIALISYMLVNVFNSPKK